MSGCGLFKARGGWDEPGFEVAGTCLMAAFTFALTVSETLVEERLRGTAAAGRGEVRSGETVTQHAVCHRYVYC